MAKDDILDSFQGAEFIAVLSKYGLVIDEYC